ncbi:MAG: PHP domain-containing protein [Candidatus Micrarchaeia archaeon]
MIKLDLHIHTIYSKDSLNSLEDIIKTCEEKNIIPAITDHDSIKAVEKIKQKYPNFRFIPGIEIKTKEGEIIGLFCSKKINPGLTAKKTIELIHKQKGLAIAVHPFSKYRNGLNNKKLIKTCDIIEVFNSRSTKEENQKAEEFAIKHKMIKCVGSDAHFIFEIGNAYQEIENFKDSKDFLKKLKKAKFYKKQSPIYVHGTTTIIKYYKKLRGIKNE